MLSMRKVSGLLSVILMVQLLLLAAAVSAAPYDPNLAESAHVSTGKNIFPARILEDFNSPESVNAWRAGANTAEVEYVTSLLNGPNQPFEGEGALEQVPELVKAYEWRTIYRDYAEPLDLSGYRYLALAANSWGWQGGADYVLKIVLYNEDEQFESVAAIKPDSWKPVFIRVGDWEGRDHITRMEISFMYNFDLEGIEPGAPGYDYWNGRFQIDCIAATHVRDLTFDGDSEGFIASAGSAAAKGGELEYSITGPGSYLESPELRIDSAKRNGLSVAMTNQTGSDRITIQWKTEGNEWDEAQAKTFEIPASGAFTQDFNFSDREDWGGVITAFRIHVPVSAGTLLIDEIVPKSMPALEKPYDGTAQALLEDGGRVAISGSIGEPFLTAHSGEKLYLFELATYEDPKSALAGRAPLAEAGLAGDFRFEVGLNDGPRSRLYSKFAIAAGAESGEGGYTLAAAPQYIANAEKLADNREPFPESKSIKGLQVQMTGDAQELGISHAAVNVAYNELMYKANVAPANVIPYEIEGKTYYFRKDRIEAMDRQIKSLSDNGIIVSLILIMYDIKDAQSANEYLIHPDAQPGGTVYALNTSNAAGVEYVKAATKFLAERYSMPSGQYGRAVNYIVGNEIGQNRVWNNMGPKTLEAYVREYAQTLRLIDTIVKSAYANARTYVSLDHFWNENLGADSLWKYDNKAIVDYLTRLIRAEGDFSWNVAFHPYPENLFNPRFWDDKTAVQSFNTERITFKNLNVLVDYMKQKDYLFDGEMRRIILSEQGFHSLSNSAEDQQLQAAAYAYAYYKIKFLDGIDAFILHRHVDHGEEGGLNLGLWTHAPNTVVTPDQQKYSYDVFKYIDTSRSLEATEFAKPIIGISSWEQAIPGFDASKLADRALPVNHGLDFVESAGDGGTDGGFEQGSLDGFAASDEVSAVYAKEGEAFQGQGYLSAAISSAYRLNWAGVQKKFAAPLDMKHTPYFTAAVQLPGADPNKAYYARFIVYSDGGKSSVEGTAKLDITQGWNQLMLPLKGWSGMRSVDGVKIWVRSDGGAAWNGELRIDEAKFVKKAKEAKGYPNAAVEAAVHAPYLQDGAEISVTVTNLGSDKLKKNVEMKTTPGLVIAPKKVHLGNVGTGRSETVTVRVQSYTEQEGIAPSLTVKLENRAYTFSLKSKTPPQPSDGILYHFEDGVQGWEAGANVASVAAVESFPNGPAKPSEGQYALSARSSVVAATTWKSVKVTPEQPLNLSEAKTFFYDIDSYGGVPGATYETRVTLRSGSDSFVYTSPMSPDQWNRIQTDISGWSGRSSVDGIEIAFRAAGNDLAWNPEFQLDRIGVEK